MNLLMNSLSHNEMQQLEVTSMMQHVQESRSLESRETGSGPGSSQSLESLVLDAEHWVHQLIVDVH